MRRNLSLCGLALIGVLSLGVYVYAAAGFYLSCGDICGPSDSGTAGGDGSSTAQTSNGSAGFDTPGGMPPSFTDLGIQNPKDLRFLLTIGSGLPHPLLTDVPCTLGLNENPNGVYTGCDYNYSSVVVNRVRFFVMTNSTYCTSVPSPCAPVSSVSLGGSTNATLTAVLFSAELVNPNGGIVLDEGESTKLHMTGNEWKALAKLMETARAADPASEFYIGFAVSVSPVDPDPDDTIRPHFAQGGTRILTIDTFAKK